MAEQLCTESQGDSGYPSSSITSRLPRYAMTNSKRGVAVIISNENFTIDLSKRSGNDNDSSNFKALFKLLKFNVETHDDQTVQNMKSILLEVASRDHTKYDCFALVIMSHGVEDRVYGTDGVIALKELLDPLKENRCESLRGKPKLFFIQACRGNEFDDGVEVKKSEYETDADEGVERITKIPKEADYLYSYSTAHGYVSYRNKFGSWYVQALKQVFEDCGQKHDILTLLTLVNHRIKELESNMKNKALSGKKQIPTFTSTLTKLLYFD